MSHRAGGGGGSRRGSIVLFGRRGTRVLPWRVLVPDRGKAMP